MEKTAEKNKYYVVKERAVPEVLLRVLQAKRQLQSFALAAAMASPLDTAVAESMTRTLLTSSFLH